MPKILQRFACEVCEHEYRTEDEAKGCEARGIKGDQFSVGEEFYKLGEMDSFRPTQVWRITEKLVNRKRHESKYRMADPEGRERTHDAYDLEQGFVRTDNPNFDAHWQEQGWYKIRFELYTRAYVEQLSDDIVSQSISDLSGRALVVEEIAKPWFKNSPARRIVLDLPKPGSPWFQVRIIPSNQEVVAPYRKLAQAVMGDKKESEPETSTALFQLNLPPQLENLLRRNGITTVEKLLTYTEDDLWRLRQFGKRSLVKIKAALKSRGVSLKSK